MPTLSELFNLDPKVERLALMPRMRGSLGSDYGVSPEMQNSVMFEGKKGFMPDVIAPKVLYDFIRAIKAPGRAARGEVLDEEEALNTALNMFGGGLATSGSVPIGALGMSARTAPAGTLPLRQVARESFVPGVEAGKEMIVHHNISPEKLAKVEKLGGMPVPSIAISNVENPMMGFGDISLIGSKEMATPSAKNPVFGFDAYTARTPNINYIIDDKSVKNLKNMFADVADDLPDSDANRKVYSLIDNWGDRGYSEVMKVKFLKEEGMLPNKKDFDKKWEYAQAIEQKMSNLKSEYADWLAAFDQKLPEAGVNVQERLFKGYTNAGNRRYAPATLENFVKEMKGGAGSENFNYGLGNLRAVASPKFRNLENVKSARGKIVPKEEFTELKNQVSDEYQSLIAKIDKLPDQKGYGYGGGDVLYDIGQAKNINLLDRFKSGADEGLKAEVGQFIKKLQKLPTEYFEIKPQRGVSVSEFQGAIIPANTPKRSIDYLRSQGLNDIHFYSNDQERKELFKKFGKSMFVGAPPVPLVAQSQDPLEQFVGAEQPKFTEQDFDPLMRYLGYK